MLLSPVIAKDEKEKTSKDLFETTKVHEFHLEVEAKEYDKLPARGGMRFPGAPPAPPKPAEKEEDKPADVHKGGGFGLEFPWVHGTFTAAGTAYKNVGLRYKGNASYMASTRSAKRNFKVALEHYEEEQRFQGLKTVNLNAGALDPTRAREALSYAVFRAAGVPAPRTSFARVTITVPGKYDKELLGLYTVVEQVDKSFLKSRFKKATGLLMKPERLRGLEYLGDDWDKYKDRYNPKHEPSKEEAKRFMDFLKLLNKGSDEEFRKEIAGYLDVDEFFRFVAVNAMVVNLDSFLMLGHNYYIYLNPDNDKIVFIPWDLDLSLASFGMAGSPEQQVDLSLTHPYPGENKLIDRLLAMPEMKEKYQKVLKDLSENCFSKENLLKDFDAIDKVVKEPIEQEKKAAAARKETGGGGFGPGPVGRRHGPAHVPGEAQRRRRGASGRQEQGLRSHDGLRLRPSGYRQPGGEAAAGGPGCGQGRQADEGGTGRRCEEVLLGMRQGQERLARRETTRRGAEEDIAAASRVWTAARSRPDDGSAARRRDHEAGRQGRQGGAR